MNRILIVLAFFLAFFVGCSKNENKEVQPASKSLTIFFVNDQHGQIEHFSKIKHIVDAERQKTNVIVACSGDMFSGNPVVDNAAEEGAPMIDLMNRVGFDISAVGNHEFDYGSAVLKKRMEQSQFDWVCANVDMKSSGVPQPDAYKTITVGDVRVSFLGLVETNGMEGEVIPSSHPYKVKEFSFEKPQNVVSRYARVKESEKADLFVALTHIGYSGNTSILGDVQLAEQFPYFDLIIGGHSHSKSNEVVNNIPIFQSGSRLDHLGKIELKITNQRIESVDFDLINLEDYLNQDDDVQKLINQYNDLPYLKEVIGFSHQNHAVSQVGCFYADALKGALNVDASFQNTGGVRAGLNQGDITRREIFEISPFKNGTVIYEMSVAEVKNFLRGTGSGFYYSGIHITQDGREIQIADLSGHEMDDQTLLRIGINDYIPAVHDPYFPSTGQVQPLKAAEALMAFLENGDGQVNYQNCKRYFRFQ